MRSNELSIELQDRIESRHRSGDGHQKNICIVEVAQEHSGNQGRRALVREETKNPIVTLTEL
jgi:hypothetical protein